MRSRQIFLGTLAIGGGAPVSIQSMCDTDTADSSACLAQIERLAKLGCQIVRLAIPDQAVLPSFARVCAQSPLPVVADIHYDYRLALGALEAGADGLRLNPGNISEPDKVSLVAKECARLGKTVRIGVNTGSLERKIEAELGRGPEAMVASALAYIDIFERQGCHNLKVSLKSSDLKTSVQAAHLFASKSELPLHLGITEAGSLRSGMLKSAIGIGALLLEGIGDTIRVSLSAPPEEEVKLAKQILAAVGLRHDRPELISCPTCGRTQIRLLPIVEAVENLLDELENAGKHLPWRKIAVMGCSVNGPGEAREADIGMAGGKGKAVIFEQGKITMSLPENEILPVFLQKIREAAR
ncbi:MAG: flavodoxin-dependent (E)-4-hydroxy-3-methylbut-2-enyl-diphosphate synthase [Oligosphaeraceae bacterium]|nr:flavodoxin-dependent (E)-4-hydroxy-3-methylbut-2-enyl-diphosphate synthase [Oligosphaeraceae bacterium]